MKLTAQDLYEFGVIEEIFPNRWAVHRQIGKSCSKVSMLP